MASDPETLARLDGKPLLSKEGMLAIDGLLAAHVEYDSAETMHSGEIIKLGEEIQSLETRRAELVAEAQGAAAVQHRARHKYSFDVQEAVENPKKSANPVYATVLKAIASDGQRGLWYPSTLEMADKMGRSLVEFDAALRGNHTSQPALIIDKERNGHVGVYVAQTKRSGGLEPATMPVTEKRGTYSTATEQRDALALPINDRHIVALQIHPNNFGTKDSLADHIYGKGPELRELEDSFKILLPQGHLAYEPDVVGKYDVSADEMADIEMNLKFWPKASRIEIAVGQLSVRRALAAMRQEFARASGDPDNSPRQQLAFDQLTQLAMGEIKLPRKAKTAGRPRRVKTNFAQV